MRKIFTSFFSFFLTFLVFSYNTAGAFAKGLPPVPENLEISTRKNESVNGVLSAYDPDGDVDCFFLTTEPIKGSIKIEANGHFIYTPEPGKKGRDYFGFKAKDAQGNVSHEGTAIIRIEK